MGAGYSVPTGAAAKARRLSEAAECAPASPRGIGIGVPEEAAPEAPWPSISSALLCIDDFSVLATIGRGSFGRVKLARHSKTDSLWAVKILKKREVVDSKALMHVFREKAILAELRHPFIVHMAAAFQDASCVYIVLEFVQGGPFDARLRDHGRVAPKAAAFYAAQVVLVLEVLHSQHYVYRDLKPANLVFDLKGYLKVCDFGLTKSVATGLCTTLCGTPDYMAPEILRKERYGIAVDWWALGVLLCEMLTGKTPFVADDPLATYHNILQHTIGRSLSDIQTTPKACVRALLTVAPTQRLGVLPNVRKHKFFKKINWKALLRRDVAPPHDPYVSSDADTSNFDEFEDSRSESHPCDFQGADPFADFS